MVKRIAPPRPGPWCESLHPPGAIEPRRPGDTMPPGSPFCWGGQLAPPHGIPVFLGFWPWRTHRTGILAIWHAACNRRCAGWGGFAFAIQAAEAPCLVRPRAPKRIPCGPQHGTDFFQFGCCGSSSHERGLHVQVFAVFGPAIRVHRREPRSHGYRLAVALTRSGLPRRLPGGMHGAVRTARHFSSLVFSSSCLSM